MRGPDSLTSMTMSVPLRRLILGRIGPDKGNQELIWFGKNMTRDMGSTNHFYPELGYFSISAFGLVCNGAPEDLSKL